MNENVFDTLKYMCIHLFIFLFKNIFTKWLLILFTKGIDDKNIKELELLIQKRDNLKEQIRELSSTSEYVQYAKMERKINNLNDEIKRKQSQCSSNNIDNNKYSNMNFFQKIIHSILNSFVFNFLMYFINAIEFMYFKNTFFEVNYEENKNNIIVNFYYNESKNRDYSLIPISRILLCETFVLNSLFNLSKKYIY